MRVVERTPLGIMAPIGFAVAMLVLVILAAWTLVGHPAWLSNARDTGNALAPWATFLTILVTATGWSVSARAQESANRRLQEEKDLRADRATRRSMRAKLIGLYGIAEEAILAGVKPFQPATFNEILRAFEDRFGKDDVAAAFSELEYDRLLNLIGRSQLDLNVFNSMSKEKLERHEYHNVRRESFVSTLAAVGEAFADVFSDAEFARKAGDRVQQTRAIIDHYYTRESARFDRDADGFTIKEHDQNESKKPSALVDQSGPKPAAQG